MDHGGESPDNIVGEGTEKEMMGMIQDLGYAGCRKPGRKE